MISIRNIFLRSALLALLISLSHIIFCFIFSDGPIVAQENNWFYPLEIKAGISSTFGEFRGDRVHTGVDLRTNMQTGYKVYAIDNGVISRIGVKKRGFGNVIYITHPNGLMSVYAHLDRFVEEALGLRTIVSQYQKQRKTKYPGDIYLEVPVTRGQLIGYSGESGYGLPHLHFEVRKGGATPIDPFKHGFNYADQTPPVIESLMIQPLGPQSFVDGEHFARNYPTALNNGTYKVEQIPDISGKVRFTLAAYDQVGAGNKCAVDRIDLYIASSAINKVDLYVDRNRLFSNQFNRVTYETNHRGGLVYDYLSTRLSNPTQYYYRLYVLDADRFPFREITAVDEGVWDTTTGEEGLHTVTIKTQDVNGNVSVARMQVDVQHQPMLNRRMTVPDSGWQAELRDFHDFLEIVCQSTTPLKAPPVVRITHQNSQKRPIQSSEITLASQGSNYFAGTYPLTSAQSGELTLTLQATAQSGKPLTQTWIFPVNPIVAARGGTVKIPHASMTFPAGALYYDIFANIFPTRAYQETRGLPVVGGVYDFRPAGVPLEKKGSIRIQYSHDVKKPQTLGIYWWDTIKERWYFMDDQHDPKTYALKADIIYPSIYAILDDTIAPTISDVVPAHNSVVAGDALTLKARIKDVGKGVDEASIVMTLDGKRLSGEYDPDRYTYKYPLTRTLASGKHTLTVQAADKAGHSAQQQTSTFTVQ
jgi:hypothetical protein